MIEIMMVLLVIITATLLFISWLFIKFYICALEELKNIKAHNHEMEQILRREANKNK